MATTDVSHFGRRYFDFLRDLEKNNNRPWFAANKERYIADVQEPSLRFIQDAGNELTKLSSHIVADAKPFGGSLSRIYRDTRFSKDKSPFHTWVGIHFSYKAGLGRAHHLPGFYLSLAPREAFAGAGVWQPDSPALTKIRRAIVNRPKDWERVLRKGLELEGETLQRPPPGFDPAHPFIRDLKRKDFVTSVRFKESQVTGQGFLAAFLEACRSMDPLNAFLAGALGLPW